ncbi:selenium-binding protein 1-like [Varroa jacobsoni]|uniref:selenium-binding protein 1-like n=1 Tax=Varroa jacobsoni TaxID=62625 RepID=UPI000BF59343|nr:selenium-binding protein 1-like [Varroa jacobsoni]
MSTLTQKHIASNPLKFRIIATVEPEQLYARNVSSLNTPRCLPGGRIIVSTMGNKTCEAQDTTLQKDFNPVDVKTGKYGQYIHIWQWSTGKLLQSIDLGPEGYMLLAVRFLHNSEAVKGYVGCALSSTIWRFFKSANTWNVEKYSGN